MQIAVSFKLVHWEMASYAHGISNVIHTRDGQLRTWNFEMLYIQMIFTYIIILYYHNRTSIATYTTSMFSFLIIWHWHKLRLGLPVLAMMHNTAYWSLDFSPLSMYSHHLQHGYKLHLGLHVQGLHQRLNLWPTEALQAHQMGWGNVHKI